MRKKFEDFREWLSAQALVPWLEQESLLRYGDSEIIAALRETSKVVTNISNTVLGFGLFCTFALAVPDSSLLGVDAILQVPIVGRIPFQAFVIIGPFLLLTFRVFLFVYASYWVQLDGERESRGIVSPAEIAPLRHGVLKLILAPVLFFLVPFLLLFFAWKGAVLYAWSGKLWVLAELGIAFHLYLTLVRRSGRATLIEPRRLACLGAILIVVLYTLDSSDRFRRRLQLSRVDLSSRSLVGQDLRKANLRFANLSDIELSRADLSDADLTGAILRGARLPGANLQRAVLYNANLDNANLAGAKLEQADLSRTSMRNVVLREARLMAANLTAADLSDADLQRADLREAAMFLTVLNSSNLNGVANLYCYQLVNSYEWMSALRSRQLNCGKPVPAVFGLSKDLPANEEGGY